MIQPNKQISLVPIINHVVRVARFNRFMIAFLRAFEMCGLLLALTNLVFSGAYLCRILLNYSIIHYCFQECYEKDSSLAHIKNPHQNIYNFDILSS